MYRLGHTHEVIICPACLGMDAGPSPSPTLGSSLVSPGISGRLPVSKPICELGGSLGGSFGLPKLLAEELNRQQRDDDDSPYQSRSAYLLAGQSEVIVGNVSHRDRSHDRRAHGHNDNEHSVNGGLHPRTCAEELGFFQSVRPPQLN
jgi:hypothetical protein